MPPPFLTSAQISACSEWLLAHASAPVRYLTRRDLLQHDPRSQPMLDLWKEVESSPAAEEIFSRQNADGTWFSGGPWGPRGYRQETGSGYTLTRPKFVTTAWILPFLGEMGFTTADARVRKSADLLLQETGSHASLPAPGAALNTCGLSAIPLRALASIGLAGDACLAGDWDWLAGCQRDDGGWLNPRHLADSPNPSTTVGRWPWERSCAWGSPFAVQALFYAGLPQYQGALVEGCKFLLWHLAQADPRKLQTWYYHGQTLVKELLMCAEVGIDMSTPPIPTLLEWLKGYFRAEEGMFRAQAAPVKDFTRQIQAIMKEYELKFGPKYWDTIPKVGSPVLRYQLYHLVEDDWLTYTLTRIAVRLS